MKKITLLIFLAGLLMLNVFAQDSYIKNRWNYKVAYSRIKTGSSYSSPSSIKTITRGYYSIETNYGIFNNLETGVYMGYSKLEHYLNSPFYGININYHLLPFIIKKK